MAFETEEQMYEMLGRYVIAFEDFCESIRSLTVSILYAQGLKNEAVHEILLEGLTAAPLLSKLHALVNSIAAKNEDERKIFSKVFSQFHEIIAERNVFLHSHWLPYVISEEERTHFHIDGTKLGLNKSGASTKISSPKIEDFDRSIKRCRDAMIQFSLISRVVNGYRLMSECFEIEGDTLKIKHEALKPVNVKNV